MGELWEEIKRRVNQGEPVSDLMEKSESIPLTTQMLVIDRQYIIEKVKAPLNRCLCTLDKVKWWQRLVVALELVKLAMRFPTVTRKKSNGTNVNTMLDIIDKFKAYHTNKGRQALYDAAFKVWLAETGHDEYYDAHQSWLVEEIIQAILDGKWMPRKLGMPKKIWWAEPEPYGGEHSIVYKLWKHREGILKLISEGEK